MWLLSGLYVVRPVASFTKEVNPRLAERQLKSNERLANRGVNFLSKRGHSLVDTWFGLAGGQAGLLDRLGDRTNATGFR